MGRWTLDTSPAFLATDLMTPLVGPCTFGSFGGNPLCDILDLWVDLAALKDGPIKLSLAALDVAGGRDRRPMPSGMPTTRALGLQHCYLHCRVNSKEALLGHTIKIARFFRTLHYAVLELSKVKDPLTQK